MSEEAMQWQTEYELGVSFIDDAHKELFSVVNKFQSIIDQRYEGKRKALCEAMLRYLIKYTNKHFAEEEAYMIKVKYPGFEMHKRLHDNLKKLTVPHLIKTLEEEHYSDDAISCLVDVLSSWLVSHILLEDQAITGSKESRWKNIDMNQDAIGKINSEFCLFAEDLFGLKMELVNRHYEGEYLGEKKYSFCSTVKGAGAQYKAMFFCDEEFIKYVVKRVSNHNSNVLTLHMLEAFEMIAQSWIKAGVSLVNGSNQVEIVESSTNAGISFAGYFGQEPPQQGLVWKCDKLLLGIAIKSENM